MATGAIPVPPAVSPVDNIPVYTFSEDSITKKLERVALNDSNGVEILLAAQLGILTEAAPATDTASSGLNGRLQRVAQRLSTLITAVGTQVYGGGTAAAAERVTLASDDPAVATLGATSGAAVITDVAGTIQQYLRGLVKQWIAGTLVLGTSANVIGHVIVDSGGGGAPSFTATTTFTCGTTAYAINDAVGASGANAALDLGVLGASAGIVDIVSASLEIDAAALISGESSYRLYLYNVTPPSAINDSSPWTGIAAGDRASFLGYIDFGTPVALGSSPATLYVRQDNIGTRVKLSGTHLFGYLVTNGAYTPAARTFLITLHTAGA